MFFLFLFLQRLPRELRMMLDEDDSLTPRQLAAKADKLWAKHTHQHGSVAAVADDDHTVAAVQPFRSRGGGSGAAASGHSAAGGPACCSFFGCHARLGARDAF